MNLLFVAMVILMLFIYGGLTYYIGYRGLQFFIASGVNFSIVGYWIVIWLIAFSFIIARVGDRWLSNSLSHLLEIIGGYWMGIMTYLIMLLFLGELVLLFNKKFQFIPKDLMHHPKLAITMGLTVISLVLIIVSYGWWSARNLEIVRYEVQLDKEVETLQEVNIVMLSDLHLGRFVNRNQLEKIVEEISSLSPDLIVMPGDIIDDRVDTFVEQNMMEVFHKLNPPLGIYASMGNHEYIGGQVEEAEKYFIKSGINVVRDQHVKIANAFYLVGREDKAYERFIGSPRKSLEEILLDVDRGLPIIMLDHQPVDIDEAGAAGVDIQLSGHTHRGQLFPFRIFTRKIFMVDWGYEKIGNTHVIVTSGAGTWGPPMRVGHSSEIVHVKVRF
ncbi:hypothetical protein SAMN05660297_02671 [Natronincola peptidivorans]|uniref:Calcineurin-like phosphoesterase domain-containing protein n=1 Tax=Natronincola peptidivorans TaxID=426128 RepID=A0A1I0F4J2_9FIRM|nr:metallophosphoesterase [Natronincola peptidivorans]SET52580.1 hypothetical protein SAMN05660297_02671 [Natronincola peptidivorans]